MFRTLFVALLAGLVLVFGNNAMADGKDCNKVSVVNQSDCELVLKGVDRKIMPVKDLVCIYFTQPRPGNVLLWVILPGQKEPRPYVKKAAKADDKFCIWRGWVQQAEALCMCNVIDGHAVYPTADVVAIALKEKMARVPGEACLYGEAECAKRGYKAKSALSADTRRKVEALCDRAQMRSRIQAPGPWRKAS